MRKALNSDLEMILSAQAKVTEGVKQPGKKRQSDQRAFIERPMEWIAVKLISFRSIDPPLFRWMV
jgi:hypothetical protein